MLKFGIQENDLDNYLTSGNLCDSIVTAASVFKVKLENDQENIQLDQLSEKERTVYRSVISDLDDVALMLNNIKGNRDKKACPYGDLVAENNGYRFQRCDNHGLHLISIRKDSFYWLIGIQYDGNFLEMGNDVNITGYYHVETNGSINDLRLALENTIQYFPKAHSPKYEMRDRKENLLPLFELLDKVLKTKINDSIGTRSKKENGEKIYTICNTNFTNEMAEKLILGLKKIYPDLKIEKYLKGDAIGISIVESDIPVLLTVADKPKKESKAASMFGVTSDSLKWITAKSIWKSLPGPQIKEFQEKLPDLAEIINKAKKFA